MTVEITIDGLKVEAEEGSMVIQAAHRAATVHPALLLSQEAQHCGQLPHVPGGNRKAAQGDACLCHAGD
ncbi:hypothetical protein CDEF62S_00794 [Castellaniella defragrans]